MKLEVYCAMCGKENNIEIDTQKINTDTTIERVIKNAKWVVQINGNNFDIYCSKSCAS